MNIRIRKIKAYRIVATCLLLLSIGLSIFAIVEVISAKPEKIVLDCIALALTVVSLVDYIAKNKDVLKEEE